MSDSAVPEPSPIPEIASIPPIGGIGPIAPIAPVPPALAPGPGTGKTNPIEVAGYWINHYKRCGQKQTDFCDDLAKGFAGAMRSKGHKVAVVKGEQDASPLSWSAATDQKAAGIDLVEFAYLATHGGTHGTELPGSKWLHWFLATFDSPDGCIVSTIQLTLKEVMKDIWKYLPPDAKKPVTTMRLGEGRLRWVVLDTCRSLHIRVENERDKDARAELAEATPGQTWGRCYDGVHLLFGFTGLSSDAGWTSNRGASFGRRAGRGEALADSWLDEAYSYWVDDVPVATAFGQSAKEVDQRMKAETLAAVGQLVSRPIRGHVYSTIWRS